MRNSEIDPAERRHCERRNAERTVGLFVESDSQDMYQDGVTNRPLRTGCESGR